MPRGEQAMAFWRLGSAELVQYNESFGALLEVAPGTLQVRIPLNVEGLSQLTPPRAGWLPVVQHSSGRPGHARSVATRRGHERT